MEASTATRRASWSDDALDPLPALARVLSATVLALVAVSAAVIWLRRSEGVLTAPLPALALFAAGAVVGLAAFAFRRGCVTTFGVDRGQLSSLASFAVPTVVSLLAAGALSLGGSSPAGLLALWLVVGAAEASSWGIALRRPRAARTGEVRELLEPPARRPLVTAEELTQLGELQENPIEDLSNLQHFVRRRDENGAEVIEGWIRAEFAASQRHATAHLAICPPFDRTPECYAELGEGPSGEVKVAQVLPWGVRLEIKLDEPTAEPTTAPVEISIQGHPSSHAIGN